MPFPLRLDDWSSGTKFLKMADFFKFHVMRVRTKPRNTKMRGQRMNHRKYAQAADSSFAQKIGGSSTL